MGDGGPSLRHLRADLLFAAGPAHFTKESIWLRGQRGQQEMSDTSIQHDAGNPGHPDSPEQGRAGRRRRIKRIALASAASLIALVLVFAGGTFFFANHVLSSVHRIRVLALSAPDQPVMPAATSR